MMVPNGPADPFYRDRMIEIASRMEFPPSISIPSHPFPHPMKQSAPMKEGIGRDAPVLHRNGPVRRRFSCPGMERPRSRFTAGCGGERGHVQSGRRRERARIRGDVQPLRNGCIARRIPHRRRDRVRPRQTVPGGGWIVPPYGYAVVFDPDYFTAGAPYGTIPAGAVLFTVADEAIGSRGLSNSRRKPSRSFPPQATLSRRYGTTYPAPRGIPGSG